MAQYQHQLQPFEENQSPSPVHEINDPFSALSQSRSRSSQHSKEPSSPINNLHRQLSGDPDAPPPAWKRRSSFTQNQNQNQKSQSPPPKASAELSPNRSNLPAPLSRRHPQLQMTTTASRPPIPAPMFDSPQGSSTSLHDPALAPPQPAFLRKSNGTRSNRSSIHSVDTSGMTSEDLWNLDAEPIADLSNPQRNAMERPLDTVRRMSQRSEKRPGPVSRYTAMPADFMWPTAPPEEEMQLPIRRKSKSTTNVPSLALTSRLGRKKTSRQISADPAMIAKVMDDSASPDSGRTPRADSVFISSAHSSSTDLTKGLPLNKSQMSLGARPPSTFYSRDFLNQLGPREGGYAIAAMLSAPPTPGQSPVMSPAEEKRKSVNLGSRPPPTSRSAGMGRWSLDGGEHYNNRPYPSTSSANTTMSNLSAPPITSPSSSPPADAHGDLAPTLPETVAAASRTDNAADTNSSSQSSAPLYPSPLSRAVSDEPPTPKPEETTSLPGPAIVPVPPIPASSSSAALPVLATKQSKKQLAKEAKAAEKADTARVLEQRAAKVREEAAKRQAEKDKAKEMKESAKKREKEEKEKKKAENRKTWTMPLMSDKAKTGSQVKILQTAAVPFPGTQQEQPISRITTVPAKTAPPPAAVDGSRRNVSMPMGSGTSSKAGQGEGVKKKSGFFDSLRKRFSTAPAADSSSRSPSSSAPPRAPVRHNTPPTPAVATSSSAPSTSIPSFVTPSTSSQSVPVAPKEEQEVVVIDSVTQAEDLPPRTTSIHHSSPNPNSHSRNPSETAAPAAFEEYNQPQQTSPQPRRNSVAGPRPMPRSASITSRNSRTAGIVSGPMVDGVSMAELSQTQSHLTNRTSRTYESGSSQTRSSQTPMTSDEEQMVQGDYHGKVINPEREDSGDTVRVGVPAG